MSTKELIKSKVNAYIELEKEAMTTRVAQVPLTFCIDTEWNKHLYTMQVLTELLKEI